MWLEKFLLLNDYNSFIINIKVRLDRTLAYQIREQIFDDYKPHEIDNDDHIRLNMKIINVDKESNTITLYKLLSRSAPWKPEVKFTITISDIEKMIEKDAVHIIVSPKIKEIIKTKEVSVVDKNSKLTDIEKELLLNIINELENRPAILSYVNEKIMNNDIYQAKMLDTKKAGLLRKFIS